MAYITESEARAAAPSFSLHLSEAELRKSASLSMNTRFDVFLSHSSRDAMIIEGIKAKLEGEGLSVYVDWLADPQADRSQVTPETARLLRGRMDHCNFLLYVATPAAQASKWMPWELGYFDGRRSDRVGVLPVVKDDRRVFVGTEYLGLYPVFEQFEFTGIGRRIGRSTGPTTGDRLYALARR